MSRYKKQIKKTRVTIKILKMIGKLDFRARLDVLGKSKILTGSLDDAVRIRFAQHDFPNIFKIFPNIFKILIVKRVFSIRFLSDDTIE